MVQYVTKSIALIFSTVLFNIVAAYAQFEAGDGTAASPYEVATAAQLDQVREYTEAHFIQTADIDLGGDDPEGAFYNDGAGWEPIGSEEIPFAGEYNGQGYDITGLYIDRPEEDYIGLFGRIGSSSMQLSGISLINVVISGQNRVGGLTGAFYQQGTIQHCAVSGTINGQTSIGGIVGYSQVGLISATFFDGSIEATGDNVGGIAGDLSYLTEFTDVYAMGSVNGQSAVGGLVGNHGGDIIQQSYARVEVSGTNNTGGLVGQVSNQGNVLLSYWDVDISQQANSAGGGEARTSDEMTYPFVADIFHEFDFDEVWGANENDNDGYPFLQWEGYPNDGSGDIEPLFPDGSGTGDDPYEVATAQQLYNVRSFPNDHFIQVSDIDLGGDDPQGDFYNNGSGWEPIGTDELSFSGTYDGQEFEISGLYINRSSTDRVGLFGVVSGNEAVIKNITIQDAQVIGEEYTGSLIGSVMNASIQNCHATASVTGSEGNFSSLYVGGLIGHVDNSSEITSCSFSGDVNTDGETLYMGGLIGQIEDSRLEYSSATATISGYREVGGLLGQSWNAEVIACYFSGDVTASGNGAGGFVSSNSYDSEISNCYARGTVQGLGSVGGFASEATSSTFYRCYAAVEITGGDDIGGFLATRDEGSYINNAYWDIEVSGSEQSAGGYGRTTADMTYAFASDIFVEWDFDSLWGANPNDNNGYPFLQWQGYANEGSGNIAEITFPEGSGTPEDPYHIATAQQLNNIRFFKQQHFIQVEDIDLGGDDTAGPFYHEGEGWEPISQFSGSYNGNEHEITGLYINREETLNIGLFSAVLGSDESNPAYLNDIDLVDVNIRGDQYVGGLAGHIEWAAISDVTVSGFTNGYSHIGGLIGRAENSSLENAEFDGEVEGTDIHAGGIVGNMNRTELRNSHANGIVDGDRLNTGGLIGSSEGGDLVEYCYFTGEVTGCDAIGGLIGNSQARIRNSYVDATIYSSGAGCGNDVGGLVGSTNVSDIAVSYFRGDVTGQNSVGGIAGSIGGKIEKVYAHATVSGEEQVGGLAGNLSGYLRRSYFTGSISGTNQVGGIAGNASEEEVMSSYWDTDSTGITESQGGEGRSTVDMTYPFTADIYDVWDFDEIWGANSTDNGGYPFFQWQSEFTSEGSGDIAFLFDGAGTKDDPYRIEHATQLDAVRSIPEKHFIQVADISLEGNDADGMFYNDSLGWEPIRSFTGSYDGNGHTISDLFINRETSDEVGLFGDITGTEKNDFAVRNLTLPNASVTGYEHSATLAGRITNTKIAAISVEGGVTGTTIAGGVVGTAEHAIMEEVTFSGNVTGNEGDYDDGTGGIAGFIGSTTIRNSSATGEITGFTNGSGGLVGRAGAIYIDSIDRQEIIIENSYATTSVEGVDNVGGLVGLISGGEGISVSSSVSSSFASGRVEGEQAVGGLVGRLDRGVSSTIENTYARGHVTATNNGAGGLIGAESGDTIQISTSYSTGLVESLEGHGGFIGDLQGGSLTNNYWNNEETPDMQGIGMGEGQGVYPRSTDQMTYEHSDDTYEAWDFTNIWDIDPDTNDAYPILRMRPAAVNISKTEIQGSKEDDFLYELQLEAIPREQVFIRVHADCQLTINGQPTDTLVFEADASALEPQEVRIRIDEDVDITDVEECFIFHEVTSEDSRYDGYEIDDVRLIVEPEEDTPPITIYNAISPNGDGDNEFLYIENIEYYEGNRVAIFNRWGDLIKRIENYNNDTNHWRPGEDVEDGQYHVVVTLGESTENETSYLVVKR